MSRSPRSRLGTCVPGYAHSAVELHAGRDKKQVTDLRVVRGSTDDTPSDGDVGIIAGFSFRPRQFVPGARNALQGCPASHGATFVSSARVRRTVSSVGVR